MISTRFYFKKVPHSIFLIWLRQERFVTSVVCSNFIFDNTLSASQIIVLRQGVLLSVVKYSETNDVYS